MNSDYQTPPSRPSDMLPHFLRKQLFSLGPKKNNCVVRVKAEKTLGRVGRYFFFFFCDGSHVG